MTPADLGRFVREEVPHYRATAKLPLTRELLDALDVALAHMRTIADDMEFWRHHPDAMGPQQAIEEWEKELRLVLGEGGEGEGKKP